MQSRTPISKHLFPPPPRVPQLQRLEIYSLFARLYSDCAVITKRVRNNGKCIQNIANLSLEEQLKNLLEAREPHRAFKVYLALRAPSSPAILNVSAKRMHNRHSQVDPIWLSHHVSQETIQKLRALLLYTHAPEWQPALLLSDAAACGYDTVEIIRKGRPPANPLFSELEWHLDRRNVQKAWQTYLQLRNEPSGDLALGKILRSRLVALLYEHFGETCNHIGLVLRYYLDSQRQKTRFIRSAWMGELVRREDWDQAIAFLRYNLPLSSNTQRPASIETDREMSERANTSLLWKVEHMARDLITGLVNVSQFDKALLVLTMVREQCGRGSRTMYEALLEGYAHKNNPMANIRQLLDTMQADGIAPNKNTLKAMLRSSSLAGNVKETKEIMRLSKSRYDISADSRLIGEVLRNLAEIGKLRECCDLYNTLHLGRLHTRAYLQHETIRLDEYTYGILANACAKKQNPKGSLRWLNRMMKDGGYRPTTIVCTAVVKAFLAQSGGAGLQRGIDMLEFMRENEVPRDVVLYTSLITAHARHRKIDTALNLCTQMLNEGIAPTPHTLTALVDGCMRSTRMQTALKLLRWLRAPPYKLRPNVATYTSLMDGLNARGHFAEAEEVYHDMIADGITPDVAAINCLMDACNRAGRGQEVLTIFHNEFLRHHLRPDAYSLSILLDSCNANNLPEEGRRIFGSFLDKGLSTLDIRLHWKTFYAYVNLLGRHGHTEDILEVLAQMKSLNVQSHPRIILAAISFLADTPRGEKKVNLALETMTKWWPDIKLDKLDIDNYLRLRPVPKLDR
ncbi:uncharacterized protein VTP21DRAFT_7809 [Calcarisporiella thermophila]|uniref:uncharacterized protein n=1 Tax=Calcarisporiella thermophila TaxID=911321 RepID=UPI0037424219